MGRIGLVLTALWIVLYCALIYLKWDSAVKMELNEWGDFLAGFSAPIAFLWLIIGYFLQRKELKQNTMALIHQKDELSKQADELKLQSEYQKQSADLARMQKSKIRKEKATQMREVRNKITQKVSS
jgi:hypothetical protein